MAGSENGEGDEAGVLDPDELDITDDERVLEIDDGRYIIASGDDELAADEAAIEDIEADLENADEAADGADEAADDAGDDDGDSSPAPAGEGVSSEDAIDRMRERVHGANSLYGFDVTAKFEDEVDRRELYSNDVVTTFENLLVWFSQHVGGDTRVEEVIGILLFESNVPVRYPGIALERLVEESGLDEDAAIADLLEYARDDQGIRFPP